MATLYFRSVGTAWNSNTSWSTTSSAGGSAGVIPTSSDTVIFQSGSAASCPVTTTAGVCLTLTTTGYTGTITMNTTLTVSGNITLGSGTTLAGTSALICNATATLTSAGNTTINCPFTLLNVATSNTYTLVDDWTLNRLFTTSSNTGALTHTINGNNIYCKAGFSINTLSSSAPTLTTGTTNINMIGTGSITQGSTVSGGLGNNLIFNTLGTITLPSAMYYKTGTFQYVLGSVVGVCILNITGNCNIHMNGYATNITLSCGIGGTTITLNSNFSGIGLSVSGITLNGFTAYIAGNVTGGASNTTGTTIVRMTNNGTLSSTGIFSLDIVIDAGVNTVTISNILYGPRSGNSTITYTSGAVNHSGTLTLTANNGLSGSIVLNTPTMSWNNITLANSTSFTTILNSPLNIIGTLNVNSNGVYTFAGTSGWTTNTLTYTNTPSTTNTGITLKAGNTYTVTNSLTLYSTSIGGNILGLKSDTGGSVAYFNMTGATQSVGNIQVTDIDSSGGQTIWAWRPGTLSNAINWRTLVNTAMQFSSTFVN